MKMLLYVMSNTCSSIAASLLLWFYYNPKRNAASGGGDGSETNRKPMDVMINRDMQIMLMIGAFARWYWSCSPTPVWTGEPTWIQWISIFDVFSQPLLWTIVVILVGMRQEKFRNAPLHFSWPVMTLASIAISAVLLWVLPLLSPDPEGWWAVEFFVIFNMLIEGVAMIPQMDLLANSKDREAVTSETNHFVGLLSLGRVFRMIFWGIMLVPYILRGDTHFYHMSMFIVPDVLHTLLMGEYLWIWLRIVKRDHVDPYVAQLHMNV